jgi:predicted ATPase
MSRSVRAAGLTARELDVLRLMASGLTNEAIAGHLCLSSKTVEAAVRSLFQKLDLVESKLENRRVRAAMLYMAEAEPVAGGLPPSLTSFVGREAQTERLTEMLSSHRLVTITGAAGCGKTRLAIEFARQWSAFGDDVRFVDLVPARSDGDVLDSLTAAFDVIAMTRSGARRQLERMLRSRPVLIVVDNAEHVADAVSGYVPRLLANDHTTLLITSRRPLGLPGEGVHALLPLERLPAVRLLRERASDATTTFADALLDDGVADAICRAVEGLPLAIELVAARLAVMSAADVTTRLGDLPKLLAPQRWSGRQSDLSSTMDSSYDALSDDQQRLLRLCSVMIGGFELRSISECFGPLFVDVDIAALCGTLVSWSLVQFDGRRYRLLEPIRQYAADLLERRGETAVARSMLVTWSVALSRDAFEDYMRDVTRAQQRIRTETSNIDAAIDAAIDAGNTADALTIVGNLGYTWTTIHASAGLLNAQRVLAACDGSEPSAARAWGLCGAGCIAQYAGDIELSRRLLSESLDLYATVDDDAGRLMALFRLGRITDEGDEAIALAVRLGVPAIQARALCVTAVRHIKREEPLETFVALLDESEHIARRAHLVTVRANALILKALAMQFENFAHRSNYPVAEIRKLADEAEAIVRAPGNDRQLCNAIQVQLRNCVRNGQIAEAIDYATEGLELAVRTDQPALIAELILGAAAVLDAGGHVDITGDLVAPVAPLFPTRFMKFILCFERADSVHPWFNPDVETSEEHLSVKPDTDELIRIAESAIASLRTARPGG